MTERDRTAYLLRFVGGGSLIVTGIIGVVAVVAPVAGLDFTAMGYGLIFALIALAGVGLALAPVLWRMFSQLRAEREARIREQERAEVAAMIHDQVLHTLALIQRNAGDTTSGACGWPADRNAPCATGCTGRPPRRPSASPPRWSRPPPRSRTPTRSRSRRSSSATPRSTSGSAALVAAGTGGSGQRRPARQGRVRLALRGGRA